MRKKAPSAEALRREFNRDLKRAEKAIIDSLSKAQDAWIKIDAMIGRANLFAWPTSRSLAEAGSEVRAAARHLEGARRDLGKIDKGG